MVTAERLIPAKELAAQFGVLTSTLAKWRRSGRGPKRWVYTGKNRVAYPETAVEEYIATLVIREFHRP
jgi:predicted DNA-binding transcriptional regulator AlpA